MASACEQACLAEDEERGDGQASDDEAAVPRGPSRSPGLNNCWSVIFHMGSCLPCSVLEFKFSSGAPEPSPRPESTAVLSSKLCVEPALKPVPPWESIIPFSWDESALNYGNDSLYRLAPARADSPTASRRDCPPD